MTDTRVSFTVAAFAVIFNASGQVLLCHRRDMDAWNLPGGGLLEGELPTEGVVREVREETGLECAVEHLVGVYVKPGTSDLIFTFRCRITGGVLALTDESDANVYYKPDRLPPNTLQKHVARILDAVDSRKQASLPVFRKQEGRRFAEAPVRRSGGAEAGPRKGLTHAGNE